MSLPSLNIHVLTQNPRSPKTYLVFDAYEASALRSGTFRVFANYIGTRSRPADSNSEPDESLPLQLTHVEVCNLIDAFPNRVNLFETLDLDESSPDYDKFSTDLEEYNRLFKEKSAQELKTKRIEELISIKDRILDGKRVKLNKRLEDIDKLLDANKSPEEEKNLKNQRLQIEKDIESLESEFIRELDTLKSSPATFPSEAINVEIFMKTPRFYESLFKVREISREEFSLSSASVYNSCKYHAYRYFWSRGFYLTGGAKFGGDFLVYPDQPNKYHSQFILVCVESVGSLRSLNLKQLITYARMATSVKKTFVLACLFEENRPFTVNINDKLNLGLISVNWSHI